MRKILLGVIISACLYSCKNEKAPDTPVEAVKGVTDEKKPASELLELSAADPVKRSFEAFAKGNVEGMVADFDENVRYTWSGGDSLVGKQAVMDYYKNRWDLFESISFNNPIVLPVQVNESQQPKYAPAGKWVLYWAMVDVKYKNGKALNFWMHTVNHFNDAGKVDFVGQYMDRHPIMEATKGMVKK